MCGAGSARDGRFDARDGEAGLRQLEEDAAQFGLKGVKLYTAEWKDGSRGWKLSDPEAQPYFEKCIELGITHIHVHKGPTIWPLDKDAFDVSDVDKVATRYQELNFIVEHVGLPRIEDFCFMATQERNVYAGLAVVIGGLMHARPRFFAKVMGELLFWVGEEKMTFGTPAFTAALCSRSTRPGPPPHASTARPPQNLYLPFTLKAWRP